VGRIGTSLLIGWRECAPASQRARVQDLCFFTFLWVGLGKGKAEMILASAA
jgi:hypothetical protein